MKVVSVSGQLMAGKDAFCDHLVGRLNGGVVEEAGRQKRRVVETMNLYGKTLLDPDKPDPYWLASRLASEGWQRSAFADAVKRVFEENFGVTRAFTEQWKRNPEPPPGMLQTVRKSLQFIGDGFRQVRADIWIDIALRDESKKLVISDSRYLDEARAVRAKGGVTVLLYRPGFLNDDPNASESQIRPVVEWAAANLTDGPVPGDAPDPVNLYDLFITNGGSLEDLHAKIDRIVVPYINVKYNL